MASTICISMPINIAEDKMDQEQIRQTVMAHYGALAQRAGASSDRIPLSAAGGEAACCDNSCCTPLAMSDAEMDYVKGLYAQEAVAGLPEGAIDAAAGCGNPTAIAELREGETVLDLGSGGGIDCFLAAKQVGPSGHVIGVDMTPDMLHLARRNAVELGATSVEFRLGEIEHLPVADSSVDVVISNCVINLSTDKEATLREAARALREGGRFRVSDIVWTKGRPAGATDLEDWSGCIAGALSLDEFLLGLESAGFIEARADSVRYLDEERGLASALISAEKPGPNVTR
jgi:arsenite methyltransferase